MRIEPNQRTAVFGFTQSGKTTLVKKLLRGVANFVVWDRKAQYAALGTVARTIAELSALVSRGHRRIVYQAADRSLEHHARLCAWIHSYLKNVLFVVEEVQEVASKSFISPEFSSLLTMTEGEPHFIGVLAISQRPQLVHNTVLTQSSVWIVFQLSSEDALYVAGKKSEISADLLKNLPRTHFIVYKNRAVDPGEARVLRFDPVPMD